jgi:hypothetical protein
MPAYDMAWIYSVILGLALGVIVFFGLLCRAQYRLMRGKVTRAEAMYDLKLWGVMMLAPAILLAFVILYAHPYL